MYVGDWYSCMIIGIKKFLELNNLNYAPISDEEKNQLKEELISCSFNMTDAIFENSTFYKVKFQEVLPLVKTRRVFLRFGFVLKFLVLKLHFRSCFCSFAYVSLTDLVECIKTKLRAMLSESLSIINQRLPQLDDDRLIDLLSTLHLCYAGNEYVDSGNKVYLKISPTVVYC